MNVFLRTMGVFIVHATNQLCCTSRARMSLQHVGRLVCNLDHLYRCTIQSSQLQRYGIIKCFGYSYKRCPLMDVPGNTEAGPSGNPTDGAPPDFRASSCKCNQPFEGFSDWMTKNLKGLTFWLSMCVVLKYLMKCSLIWESERNMKHWRKYSIKSLVKGKWSYVELSQELYKLKL